MIRRAETRDTSRIMDLLSQVLTVHHKGRPDLFKGGVTKYTEEELHALLRDPLRPIFVWTDEGDTVQGYAFCIVQEHPHDNILTDIRTLYIDDLCVDEKVRGRHIGKSLYEYVLDFAKAGGFYNVTLNVWSCNPSALRFYESLGLTAQKIGMEKIL